MAAPEIAEAEPLETVLERASSKGGKKATFDGRAFRRSLGKTGRYQRNPTQDPESLALMEEHGVGYSTTGLVAQMRLNGNVWQHKARLGAFCVYCYAGRSRRGLAAPNLSSVSL